MIDIWLQVLEPVAYSIGCVVMAAGGVMLASLIVYFPCNIAWKKFVDTAAFVRVVREAKRHGVDLWRD